MKRRRRRIALGAVVLASATIAVSSAGADSPGVPGAPNGPADPCATVNGAASSAQGSCDTLYTPTPKDGFAAGWQQQAGATFPGVQQDAADQYHSSSSPVPDTVDFYTVSFENENHGLAAGAECADPNTPEAKVADCRRVPVIYSYSQGNDGIGTWTQVYGPEVDSTDTQTGFVGAITWLGSGKALAVGGTGCYPTREDPTCADAADAPSTSGADPLAGNGRAWLMQAGGWSEVTSQLPTGTTGMAALDHSPRPGDCGSGASECAYAGGLRELVSFVNGRFVRRLAPGDPQVVCPSDAGVVPSSNTGLAATPAVSQPTGSGPCADWLFRVRAIRFAPGNTTPAVAAVAVTSGCCDTTDPYGRANDEARVLLYDGGR